MLDHNTDEDWEEFARSEPYWSVLSAEEFRRKNLRPEVVERFFRSGEESIASVVEVLGQHYGSPKSFELSLDFGCGLGRLLLPLAARSKKSIGLDVSPTMLKFCRENADRRNVRNIELVQSTDDLAPLAKYAGKVDLITSYIVFQHIPPRRGFQILNGLLRLLRRGGVGYLHFTFAAEMRSVKYEADNVCGSLYRYFERTPDGIRKLVEHPAGDTQIQMNHYNMNELLCYLYENGIADVSIKFTNHSGTLGAECYIRKS